ncbi:sulfite exporter TauE/SafE family protein [Kutzneria sp. NPDC052558]|uniref:sulfite exporter TauE/SafE family protein n=1 Tax=Kutzneria sp. NPDC052558 TaxID=3364121 RepID=UPI0037C98799
MGSGAFFLVAAGIVAGTVGSAGAIASLISYPALLAFGLPAVSATIANSVAAVAIGVGSAPASRPELKGSGRQLWRLGLLAGVGGAAGAALLLVTPNGVFEWIVPFLIAASAFLLLLQPRLSARRRISPPLLTFGLFVVAGYNGYFGPGSGIMMLTVLAFTFDGDLPRANAVKNVLLAAGEVVVAIGFIVFSTVPWAAVIPLAVGFLVGGAIGPWVVRRLPVAKLRTLIAAAGFALAAWLLYVAAKG